MKSMPHNTLDLPDILENEADNEGPDKTGITGVDKVKCRGPGHIRACDFCFFVDERFGRHWRCKRQCITINGQWGPTICCEACDPEALVSDSLPRSPELDRHVETGRLGKESP